jgi:hypothetical protein
MMFEYTQEVDSTTSEYYLMEDFSHTSPLLYAKHGTHHLPYLLQERL